MSSVADILSNTFPFISFNSINDRTSKTEPTTNQPGEVFNVEIIGSRRGFYIYLVFLHLVAETTALLFNVTYGDVLRRYITHMISQRKES